jgi:hypothetical protein
VTEQWFLRVADKEYGPVDLATLREWQGEGRVIATNEIRRADSPEWQLAGTVEELFPPVTAPADAVIRRRTWAEILRETFRIYARGFPHFILLGALTAIPSFFLQELVPFTMPSMENPTPQMPAISPAAIALMLLLVLLWPISAAGMQLVADDVAHKQRPRFRDLLRNTLALWPRILLLGILVYGCYTFWLVVPFAALLSLAAQPTIVGLLLIVVIGGFMVYMNARLFINFLFWLQSGALTELRGIDALRESKRLARSRGNELPLDRPLYRGGIIASVWLLLLLSAMFIAQLPFVLVRFAGVSDPAQAMAMAQQLASAPRNDTLTIAANVTSALLHLLLRPLLAASFVLLYYDAKAGAPEQE